MAVWYQVVIAICILLISAGLGYGAFLEFGNELVEVQISRLILDFPNGTEDTVSLGAILTNKFGIAQRDLRRILPLLAGLMAGIVVLLLAGIVKFAKILS